MPKKRRRCLARPIKNERRNKRFAKLTSEQIEEVKQKERIAALERRENESEGERFLRLEKRTLDQRYRRSKETNAQRAARIEKNRIRAANKRKQLILDGNWSEIERVREKARISAANRFKNETAEKRELRLEKQRIAIAKKREGSKKKKETKAPAKGPAIQETYKYLTMAFIKCPNVGKGWGCLDMSGQ